jgi:pilus assembly protein Flp/PilA
MMKLLRNKKGQGMSEYLIILALVAIATIGAVIFFADNVRDQISNLAMEIAGDTGAVTLDTAHQAGAELSGDMATFVDSDE